MKLIILFLSIFSSSLIIAQNARDYIREYSSLAIHEMNLYAIPASITLAQGILESASGTSTLATEGNNHFGIKCHIDWKGATIYHDDDEKNECFRKYKNVSESFRDHSIFLSQRGRYSFLFKLRKYDYKGWAKGLQKAGYATSKTYAKKLIKIINEYNLEKYDRKKISKKDKKKFNLDDEYVVESKIHQKNYTKYIIAEQGQSYDDIAEELDVWLWELLKYNESENDRILIEGEKVYLQPKRKKGTQPYHIVKEGETMYFVAQLYGIKLKYLYKKNRMEEGSEPYIGQRLQLIKKVKFN